MFCTETAFSEKGANSPCWNSAFIYGGLPGILLWPGPSSRFARRAWPEEGSHAGD